MRCAIFVGLLAVVIALCEAGPISNLGRGLLRSGILAGRQTGPVNMHEKIAPAKIAETLRDYGGDDDRTPAATLQAFMFASFCMLEASVFFYVPEEAWTAEDLSPYENTPWFDCFITLLAVDSYSRGDEDEREYWDHVFLLHIDEEKCNTLGNRKDELEEAVKNGDLTDPDDLQLLEDLSLEVGCHCQKRGQQLQEWEGSRQTRNIRAQRRLRRSSKRYPYSHKQYGRSYDDDGPDECSLELTTAVLDAIVYSADCLLGSQHTDAESCDATIDAVEKFVEGDDDIEEDIEKHHGMYMCGIWGWIGGEYETAMTDWRKEILNVEEVKWVVDFIKSEAEADCKPKGPHNRNSLSVPMLQELESLLRELKKQTPI